MVKELDGRRAFDRWLVPLLSDVTRRKWRVELHLDGDKEPPPRGVAWPDDRRWGPPRAPEDALPRLTDRNRTFRNVVLRIDGDHAGLWLALEAGLHRFVGFGTSEPMCLHVQLMALRTQVDAPEWIAPAYEPPNAQVAEELSRIPPNRTRTLEREREHVKIRDAQTSLDFDVDGYWPDFEEVALEHLLLFERGLADRDEQLRPALDDRFHEVRALIRRGEVIGAIKLYREITGLGLKESKDAVDAMRS
jgi:ATP-dependent Clp protease ATP-binding subunit ClpC